MKKQVKITIDNLKEIYGEEFAEFEEKILPNCYCGKCGDEMTIVSFEIFLNDLNDVILRGFCTKYGHPVNRYVETGEVPEFEKRIGEIRNKYIRKIV